MESLEDRTVPAVIFTVNTLQDTVDNNPGDGEAKDANGDTSLRAALMEGNAGGENTITVKFAQFLTGTISLGSVLPRLTKNYTVMGPGSANLTVSRDPMAARFRIFDIFQGETCSIQGLTISGGDETGSGGAIENGGNLTLIGCKILYNRADIHGGAVWNAGGNLTVADCWVYDNQADGSGGAFWNSLSGTLNIVSGCKISSNGAGYGGGIFITSGTCTVRDASEITGNYASATGGGVCVYGGTFTMTGGKLEDNFSDVDGGGIYNESGTSSLTGVSIQRNTASTNGGGFYVSGGSITFDSCTISGNTATTGPGGFRKAPGTYVAINCTITDEIVQIP